MPTCEFCDEAPATAECTFGENTPVCDTCKEYVEFSSDMVSGFLGFTIILSCCQVLGFKPMVYLLVTQPFFSSLYNRLKYHLPVIILCFAMICVYDLTSLTPFVFINLLSYPFLTKPLRNIKYNF